MGTQSLPAEFFADVLAAIVRNRLPQADVVDQASKLLRKVLCACDDHVYAVADVVPSYA